MLGPDPDDNRRVGAAPLLRSAGRLRTCIFISISLAAYVAANMFWQYLSTGEALGGLSVSLSAWQRMLVTPLGEVLYRPLSIFSHPWMILVTGLLLGMIVFVPVMVSVLYRLWVAAMFVAVTFLVGHAPVLGLTLGLGCFLAACTPMRSKWPFLAVLVGILPSGLYLCLATFTVGDAAEAAPMQKLVLYTPLAAALLAAMAATAVVLALARRTGYRPGVLWPTMAVLLAVPVAVFFWKIGAAELDYALIARPIGSNASIFSPSLREDLSRRPDAAGLSEDRLADLADSDLKARRGQLADACLRFLARYPYSRRAPEVRWVLAQCRTLQLDRDAFRSGTIKYAESFTPAASRADWEALAANCPDSPQAAIARWRLGELAVRDRKCDLARNLLVTAVQRLRTLVPSAPPAADRARIFARMPSLPPHQCYETALFEAQRLLWMIDGNGALNDDRCAAAMAAFLNINPCEGDYYDKLRALLKDEELNCERTPVGNEILVAAAKACADREKRVEMLAILAEDASGSDAAVEANYELGCLAMQKSVRGQMNLKQPRAYFQCVLDRSPNPWKDRAEKWMATTQP